VISFLGNSETVIPIKVNAVELKSGNPRCYLDFDSLHGFLLPREKFPKLFHYIFIGRDRTKPDKLQLIFIDTITNTKFSTTLIANSELNHLSIKDPKSQR
jgi:hypothetical protein